MCIGGTIQRIASNQNHVKMPSCLLKASRLSTAKKLKRGVNACKEVLSISGFRGYHGYDYTMQVATLGHFDDRAFYPEGESSPYRSKHSQPCRLTPCASAAGRGGGGRGAPTDTTPQSRRRRRPRVPKQNLAARLPPRERPVSSKRGLGGTLRGRPAPAPRRPAHRCLARAGPPDRSSVPALGERSEERRVGKEGR